MLPQNTSWGSHFADVETRIDDLREHFIVENEVVGVCIEVAGFQHVATESAVARVVFRELISNEQVLQDAVENVLVERYPAPFWRDAISIVTNIIQAMPEISIPTSSKLKILSPAIQNFGFPCLARDFPKYRDYPKHSQTISGHIWRCVIACHQA
jgi:hypothetical protein